MPNNTSQWLLGLSLVAYPIFCLLLVFWLIIHTPADFTSVDDDELSSTTLLPDFASIDQTPERKAQFLAMLTPLVEAKNAVVLKSRERLLNIKAEWDSTGAVSGVNERNLEKLRSKYKVSHETYPETDRAIEILLLRVDMIPPAMVLAQAAIESGWGTSRFAEEAHNLFGQWCYEPGCGLVPARRVAGAKHEVKKFNSVEESLTAYFNNINTHGAYRPWRQLRAQLRQDAEQFTGQAMVAELHKYSQRGQVYVDELRRVIRLNNLE
ncbi:glucosaminidase domain-containing protein [Cellvibrio japonicus]|uniref:Endo-beta-N-acetylglucosaminidase, putative, acm73A n=1 Tax=Cellvibrio japonicus (strain Ueda107) TaxID=498211 RepID=B3PDS2_CELJU|nr:glucosaminidase domain-containing protein [Cellvibrio japonicus]ACE84897.1 endo-beta-N-acetylglucosaminidase, putative, acm73A [Cellvibrio japonicus Ueda107]QEI13412.1 endo-beta-N-acetylglucosaminidase [Cellvibrio japonicus]QEI16986.1 endo-beta-N-acetylglucosaminidase [Cellvibrio japonicus]QEI20564.1 endo-beta-N-acetylglucosaminidase [Cellvibrio japonicus]